MRGTEKEGTRNRKKERLKVGTGKESNVERGERGKMGMGKEGSRK